MEFKNISSEELIKRPPKKAKEKVKVHTGLRITIGNVHIYINKNDVKGVVISEKTLTIERLVQNQKLHEGYIRSIDPPMYSAFQSSVSGILEPYVKEGDRVVYKKAAFMPDLRGDIKQVHTVTKVELSSLGNMSVFAAALDNGDTSILTNFLKKV